jgi:hypothetical protein
MEIKISKTIKELVKEYPNDYDLGSKVRELVIRMEKIEKANEEKVEKDEK